MKTYSLLITVLLLAQVDQLNAQVKSPVQVIREDLFYSEFDLDKCITFYKSIAQLNDQSPLIQAYQAAAQALIAKHSWNPISKISNLNNAQKLLNEAIAKDNLNPEIRFLRLYIENSLPNYLGISKHTSSDKKVIIDNIETLGSMGIGKDIVNYIVSYISSPEVSNTTEIEIVRKKMAFD